MAFLASLGMSALSSVFARSCSRYASRVRGKTPGELGPSVRRVHVNNPNRLDSRSRGLDFEQARGSPVFTASRTLFPPPISTVDRANQLRPDLDPFAAAVDDRQRRGVGGVAPYCAGIGPCAFPRPLLPRTTTAALIWPRTRLLFLDDAVQCRRHPAEHRVLEPGLDVFDDAPRRALVPLSVQVAPLPARAGLVGCPNGIAAPIRPAGHAEASAWDRDEGRNSI